MATLVISVPARFQFLPAAEHVAPPETVMDDNVMPLVATMPLPLDCSVVPEPLTKSASPVIVDPHHIFVAPLMVELATMEMVAEVEATEWPILVPLSATSEPPEIVSVPPVTEAKWLMLKNPDPVEVTEDARIWITLEVHAPSLCSEVPPDVIEVLDKYTTGAVAPPIEIPVDAATSSEEVIEMVRVLLGTPAETTIPLPAQDIVALVVVMVRSVEVEATEMATALVAVIRAPVVRTMPTEDTVLNH
jgi:hypothetical protein